MRTVSLRLPEAIVAKLAVTARARGQSKSSVVRTALAEHLSKGDGPIGGGSCLDDATDLVGCVEADSDLSSHDRHLEEYGR